LVVDCKGADLLDELQEVDGAVEEGGLEFGFDVGIEHEVLFFEWLDGGDVARDVDKSDDVDCELAEDGTDDVRVEDVGLRAFFGECFDGLEDRNVLAGCVA